MSMHLDIEVDDLAASVAYAVSVGAEVAPHQPQETVRVMLDPAGHPFCLYLDPADPGLSPHDEPGEEPARDHRVFGVGLRHYRQDPLTCLMRSDARVCSP
jgi:Glyoxalase-like domain